MCETGEPPLSKAQECYDWHDLRIKTRSDDAKRYGIPLIISEFGACNESPACNQEIKSVVDICDKYLVSWTFWQFKNFKGDYTKPTGEGKREEGVYGGEGFYYSDGKLQETKVK